MLDSYSRKFIKRKTIRDGESGDISRRGSRCVEGDEYRTALQTTADIGRHRQTTAEECTATTPPLEGSGRFRDEIEA